MYDNVILGEHLAVALGVSATGWQTKESPIDELITGTLTLSLAGGFSFTGDEPGYDVTGDMSTKRDIHLYSRHGAATLRWHDGVAYTLWRRGWRGIEALRDDLREAERLTKIRRDFLALAGYY